VERRRELTAEPRYALHQSHDWQETRAVQRLPQDLLRQGRTEDPLQRGASARDASVHRQGLQHDVQLAQVAQPTQRQSESEAALAASTSQDLAARRPLFHGARPGVAAAGRTPRTGHRTESFAVWHVSVAHATAGSSLTSFVMRVGLQAPRPVVYAGPGQTV